MDNDDGDFWKDKFFKAKTLRYICYTKEVDENPVIFDCFYKEHTL